MKRLISHSERVLKDRAHLGDDGHDDVVKAGLGPPLVQEIERQRQEDTNGLRERIEEKYSLAGLRRSGSWGAPKRPGS